MVPTGGSIITTVSIPTSASASSPLPRSTMSIPTPASTPAPPPFGRAITITDTTTSTTTTTVNLLRPGLLLLPWIILPSRGVSRSGVVVLHIDQPLTRCDRPLRDLTDKQAPLVPRSAHMPQHVVIPTGEGHRPLGHIPPPAVGHTPPHHMRPQCSSTTTRGSLLFLFCFFHPWARDFFHE